MGLLELMNYILLLLICDSNPTNWNWNWHINALEIPASKTPFKIS